MGAGGIAAAFVLLLVLAVLLFLLVIAVILLATSWNQRRRGTEPSPWLQRVAVGLLVIVVGVPTAAITWAQLQSDPDVLELDLRSTIAEDELPGEDEPGFTGFYDYDSDTVELRLPGDARFTAEVDSTVVTVKDERVTSVSVRRLAMAPSDAAKALRTWAEELDLDTDGIDDALDDTSRPWESEQAIGDVTAKLALQPTGGGEKMIPRVRFEP